MRSLVLRNLFAALSGLLLLMQACAANRIYYKDYEDITAEASDAIMSMGEASQERLAGFLLEHNSGLSDEYADYLAALYIYEAQLEGVNHDIAFAQMCLETGFLKFDGVADASQNNFAGLGAVDNQSPGETFSSPAIGIRAHIQHLKAYASSEALAHEQVDPRFHYVERGSATTVRQLEGSWSTDSDYAEKIEQIIERLFEAEQ